MSHQGPPSPTIIRTCETRDLAACFAIVSAAFGHEAPFLDFYFPDHDMPAGNAQGIERFQKWQATDPDAHFVCASRGEGANRFNLGIAVWTYMREPPSPHLEELEDIEAVWGRIGGDAEVRYAKQMWAEYVKPRSEAIRQAQGKGVFVLELLAVHPAAHHSGIGEMLVRWGTQKADERNVEAVVEGTPVALKLYKKCGFRVTIPEMRFDVDDEFKLRRQPKLSFLRKQASREKE